jgi:hypothetical protein
VILFYEMVHIWTHLFVPAILSAFIAVGLVVAARARNSLTGTPFDWIRDPIKTYPLITLLSLVMLAFLLGVLAFRRFKPNLGFDD